MKGVGRPQRAAMVEEGGTGDGRERERFACVCGLPDCSSNRVFKEVWSDGNFRRTTSPLSILFLKKFRKSVFRRKIPSEHLFLKKFKKIEKFEISKKFKI